MNDDHESLARDVLELHGETHAALEPVTIGMSEASVFRAGATFVKVATGTAATALRDEAARTQWLAARGIHVPLLLRIDDRGGSIAVLMAAMAGVPADESPLPTPVFVQRLGQALAELHALPIAPCPFDESVTVRLARAQAAIDKGDVNPSDFEPRNRKTKPADLLHRLRSEQPRDDIVVLHGDATLGNIIIDGNGIPGFIDCGNAGRGGRYTDLVLLHADIVEHRGVDAGAQFLAAYGAQDFDTAKARFYLDLYELF
ncbi:MAG: aminoglycoside 3'-phosphotransferase [Pseudolabrys sp.]|nr:aminoglycoside 3'-phosphotransferase [Pseudolabrys sp.]